MSNNFFYDIKKLFGATEKQKLAEDASWGMAENADKVKADYDSELTKGEIDIDRLKQLAHNFRDEKSKEEKSNAFEASGDDKFVDYVFSFYGKGGIYDMGVSRDDIAKAVAFYKKQPDTDFAADSFDREHIRDILIDKFGYEWVSEAEEKADKDYDKDGKIESPKDEVWGARARAAAKAGKPFSETDEKETVVKTRKELDNALKNQEFGSKVSFSLSDMMKDFEKDGKKDVDEADVMSLEEGPAADDAAVRELVLFADNDHNLYRQSYEPIIKNLQRKVNKGIYDVELAKKLWGYHAERAAKAYAEQLGNGRPWNRLFSPEDRRAAAAEFEKNAREEIGAEELAETQTDDAVAKFQDRQRDEKMKRLTNPRDYFESVLNTEEVVEEQETVDSILESLSAMLEGKSKKDKKTEKEDQKAEKAGKKVAKDIEYDEDHKGKDDDKAEKAGKKVTKDIEYDDKKDRKESSKKVKDAIKKVVIPAQREEAEKYQATGRIDPKKFKKEFVNKELKKLDEQLAEQLSYAGEDAESRQYNGNGHNDAHAGLEFEDTQSSSGGSISSKGGVTRHTAGDRYAALDTDDENEFGSKPRVKKAPSGLGRGRPPKEKAPEYTKMNDPFGRVTSIPKGKKGTVHKIADPDMDESAKPDFLDMDKDGNKSEPMKKAVADKQKGSKELDEKAVSKKQQKFMGMVHAAQQGEKPASKAVAKVAKSMGKQDVKDFAATKHKGLPEKVKEEDRDNVMDIPNTAGAAHTQTKPGTSKDGIVFGGSIYEQFDAQLEKLISINESVDITMARHDQNGAEQDGAVVIQADGVEADLIKDLLRNAGLINYENDLISQQNTQNVDAVADANTAGPAPLDVNQFCPVCDCIPCACGSQEETCDGEEEIAFELEEADAPVTDNEPDWPTNQETSDDALQYAGGLNKPKSTGQTTIPVVASQLNRQHSMEENVDLERSLFKTWKNYTGE